MSWADIDSIIENEMVRILSENNTAFEVLRFYDSSSEQEVMASILSKVSSSPCVFVRVTGDNAENIGTLGQITNITYTVEVILAASNHGKQKQIRTEPRKVNILKAALLARLAEADIQIPDQGAAYFTYVNTVDLFTTPKADARLVTFQVQGVTQDMSSEGLNQMIEALLNG